MQIFNLKNYRELEFDKIFEDYKRQVYNQVFAIAKSQYAAEEITQEIFIKLWQNQDALKEVKNLDGYIYTIVRNQSLNFLRKAASEARLSDELMRVAVNNDNATESALQVAEYKKLILNAVSQLSPQRRIVYKLSREEGLNYDEIAAQLNLSKHTVKNHLLAALDFIRYSLTKNGIDTTLIAILTFWSIK